MISLETIKLATELAETASFSGKYFTANPTSATDTLLKTLPSVFDSGTEEDIIDARDSQLSVIGSHQHVENKVVLMYGNIVCNIVNAARNTVKPLVDTIYAGIQEEKERTVKDTLGLYKEIIQLAPPKLLYDEQFISFLSEYKDTIFPNLEGLNEILGAIVGLTTANVRRSIALTGNGNLDDKLNDVYNSRNSDYLSISDSTSPDEVPLTILVNIFMLLNGVINHRSDTTSSLLENVSTENKILTLRNALGGALFRLCNDYLQDIDSNVLFCKRPRLCTNANTIDYSVLTSKNKIYVYAKAYSRWIEEGGSIEWLLGYTYNCDRYKTLYSDTGLTGSKEESLTAYTTATRSMLTMKTLEDISLVKQTTFRLLEDYLNETFSKDDSNLIQHHQRLYAAIEHDYHGASDIIPYLIKVISRTLFPSRSTNVAEINKSDVKDILLEVHAQTVNLESPSEDNYEEALVVAIVRLITKFVSREVSIN
jgi:hypothetical protein